jgi:hypothetical protein
MLIDFPDMAKYLAKAGRVKCIKLKNVISNGLVIELDKFIKYFNDEKEMKKVMKEGYSFTHIKDIEICHKYTPPPARNSGGNGNEFRNRKREPNRLIEGIFHFHFDTDQLLRNVGRLNPDDTISISRKIHGTSTITGNILVKRKLSLIEKISKFIGIKVIETEYDYIYASRNTVKNARKIKPELLNVNDIWINAGQKYFLDKLYKGETVYYEIVGYLPSGSMVQKGYDYGCEPKEYKIVVYRITMTNVDGNITEYSWTMMKGRCKELNVDMVEEFYYGKAGAMFYDYKLEIAEVFEPTTQEIQEYKDNIIKSMNPDIENADISKIVTSTLTDEEISKRLYNMKWGKYFVNKLKETYLDKDCWDSKLPKKMPDEGIVLRIEGLNIKCYKLKSDKFTLQESKAKEDGVEDMEESEAVNNNIEEEK